MRKHISRVEDLVDPSLNRIGNMDVDEARRRVMSGEPAAIRPIQGSFAIVGVDGITVRMARSLDRPMRYFLAKRAEGPALYVSDWGVGRIKHSLTYSGGLSRSYVRTYAPGQRYGFAGFSPYTSPDVIEVAEGIPFAKLTGYDVPALYALEGEIVRRGVKAITGLDMPVFPKRRFQHGAMSAEAMRARIGQDESGYRRTLQGLYG